MFHTAAEKATSQTPTDDRGSGTEIMQLSLFKHNKLRVFAVFLIGTDEKEFHIGSDAKATVTAEFAFQLIAQIGRIVIEELHHLSVRQAVFEIDKAPGQHVQILNPWQALNVKQRVEFRNELLFEFLKFLPAADPDILLPEIHRKIAVGIAPPAVFLVEFSVGFLADHGILQRHSAAAAGQRSRRSEERVD